MGPLTLGDVTMDLALQAHLSLQREVPLEDIARVPREVGEEATVEDAASL